MGLFGFGKKKNEHKNEMKSSLEFYRDCVVDSHNEAKKFGVASKGLIFIPELIPAGEKTILAYLKDPFFQMELDKNAEEYYYFMMVLAIDAGMVYASTWHEQYSALGHYVEKIIQEGSADDANILLTKYLPQEILMNQGNPFFSKIYSRWLTMHEPYWKLNDPREYTFKALLASYQLGISIILEKLGY